MKKTLLIPALFLFQFVNAQSIDWAPLTFNDNGDLEMMEVVEVESKSVDEIYNQSKIWFSEFYKNSKEVIQVDDKESGLIQGKAIASHYHKVMGQVAEHLVQYTIKIEIKEGRYRLTLYNYILKNPQYGNMSLQEQFTDKMALKKNGDIRDFPMAMKEQTIENWEQLKESLNKKVTQESKEDW